jgi:N-acetylneuraminic acid mutarotase
MHRCQPILMAFLGMSLAPACGDSSTPGESGGAGTRGTAGAGGTGGSGTGLDASGLAWKSLPPLPGGPRQETGVAALDRKVYVVGGFTTAAIVATVEAYDPATNTWSPAAPLPKALHHANTAAVSGKLYVVGAQVDATFRAIGDVYAYDPRSGWSAKTPLPMGQERGASAVAVVGSKIYVAGGDRGGSVTDFSAYDTETDTHVSLPPLPAPRDHLVGSAIGARVYAIGGRAGGILYGSVDAFDTVSGTWSTVADVRTRRAGAAAAVLGDRIVVAGGEGNVDSPDGVFSQTEAFVPTTSTWVVLPDLRTPRHGTGAAVIDNTFYVPGGATKQGFGATDVVEALEL